MSNFDHRRLCGQSVINKTLLHLNITQAREFIRKKLFNNNHESFEGFMNAFRTKIQSLRKLFYHFHITRTGSVLTEPNYFRPIFMLFLKEIITAANLTSHSLELGSTFPLYKNVHVQMRDEGPVMEVRLSGECDIVIYKDDCAADSINCLMELKYPTHSLYQKYANKEKCHVVSELMGWQNVLGETSSQKRSRSQMLLCAILIDIFAIVISFKFDNASDEYYLTESVQNEDEYLLSLLLALISKSMIGRWELFQLYQRGKMVDEADEEGGKQSEPFPSKKKSRFSSSAKKIRLKSGNNRRKTPQRHTKKRQMSICDDNDGVIYCYDDDDDDDRSKRFLEEWFSAHRGHKLLTENNLRVL
jgi:hypothetical protein